MKNKKSQGISVNVIIIAAVALIVLVVLVAVFTGRFGIFSRGVSSTGDPSKDCTLSAQDPNNKVFSSVNSRDSCEAGEKIISAQTDPGKICCAKVK